MDGGRTPELIDRAVRGMNIIWVINALYTNSVKTVVSGTLYVREYVQLKRLMS